MSDIEIDVEFPPPLELEINIEFEENLDSINNQLIAILDEDRGSLQDNISGIENVKNEIRNAIEFKGVSMDGVLFPEFPDKILEIPAPDPYANLWKPEPDWFDIRSILAANPQYNTIILLSDVGLTYTNSLYPFITSDGGSYSAGQTHKWDLLQDKPCSKGYSTRWVMFNQSSLDNNNAVIPDNALYVVYSHAYIISSITVSFISNKNILQAVEGISDNIVWSNPPSITGCASLVKIGGSISSGTIVNPIGLFGGLPLLAEYPSLDNSKISDFRNLFNGAKHIHKNIPKIIFSPNESQNATSNTTVLFNSSSIAEYPYILDFSVRATATTNNFFGYAGLNFARVKMNICNWNFSTWVTMNRNSLQYLSDNAPNLTLQGLTRTITFSSGFIDNNGGASSPVFQALINKGWTIG